jgi:L-erythro-3,5-diaminohexanoate dehydrogenase
MKPCDNEILIDVNTLNIDAASFVDIKKRAGGDPEKMKEIMLGIVAERGKHHNPNTGSGGMFMGTVREIGSALAGKIDLKPGDRIASLVSLSLTPLKINRIKAIHMDVDQVDVEAQAILFESGIYAKLPADMPETLALAVLDVAGAPAQTAKLVRPGNVVLVVGGGGKSGMLCLYEAKKRAGVTGKVIALVHNPAHIERLKAMGLCDEAFAADATNAVQVLDNMEKLTGGKMADVTINCVNIPGTEMASILATHDGGIVYFFSMATSFTAAALGAEGIGRDVDMIIGNGYTKGHAEVSLQELRESEVLRKAFTEIYAR